MKVKLQKYIDQHKIDYSQDARLKDIERLISQQKYNCAVWELNSLIEEGYSLSVCYELLGDISYKTMQPSKKPQITTSFLYQTTTTIKAYYLNWQKYT